MRSLHKAPPPSAPNNGGAGKETGHRLLPHYWGRGGLLRLSLCAVGLLAVLGTARVFAAPPNGSAPAPAVIPDYGGRDSAPLGAEETTHSADGGPAAQAGRAVEALVIVLAGVAGVVYALKRFGLVQGGADGKPARIMLGGLGRPPSASTGLTASSVTVASSQTLPGGAMLHVVSVPGRTLLLAATSHTVTAVAEWGAGPEGAEDIAAFEAYLGRAGSPEAQAADTGLAAANARLRSLLSRPQSAPKDSL